MQNTKTQECLTEVLCGAQSQHPQCPWGLRLKPVTQEVGIDRPGPAETQPGTQRTHRSRHVTRNHKGSGRKASSTKTAEPWHEDQKQACGLSQQTGIDPGEGGRPRAF